MAFDAISVHCLIDELSSVLVNGRIDKIHQPEKDELTVHIRTYTENYRLTLSAGSANPRVHFTSHAKKNPLTAPMFCMLLRKHLSSGRITAVEQIGFERIIRFSIESYNELGDLTTKYLIAEIMGRHSNIILTDSDMKILDSIKHIDAAVSSVRQVLPGLTYAYPPAQDKVPLTEVQLDTPINFNQPVRADKLLLSSIGGISPLTAREIVYRAFNTTDIRAQELNTNRQAHLKTVLYAFAEDVRNNKYHPCMITDKLTGKLLDFSPIDIKQYESTAEIRAFDSMSQLLEEFYYTRDMRERMRQKSAGLVKLVNNNIERLSKKINILTRTLADAENKELYRIKGDLITSNLYRLEQGMKQAELENFYETDMPKITIELDPRFTPSQNAQRYYKRYNKAKTAEIEAAKQLTVSRAELDYLESTLVSIENAELESDINAVKTELAEQGFAAKRTDKRRKTKSVSKPLHFISSDGFDIYVGKNNTQNDYVTTKLANSQDIWFHTKNIHGSHAVIKLGLDKNVPESTMREAAQSAAYYSKARESSQVPVDYCPVKNVKKPNGAKPGMVIYEGYNTVYVSPKKPEGI
ncbi:MAG: NFACT RNA binding domain-containing protein [bacterium]|nr:NFACT RNA binding domain-containing protein [bacterium]